VKIAFLALEPTYSSKRLREEAVSRGHTFNFIDFEDCKITAAGIIYRGELLEGYDAVLPRIMPDLFGYGVELTRAFEGLVPLVADTSQSIEIAGNKLKTHELLERAGMASPRTCAFSTADELDDVISQLGLPLVIKTSVGTQGAGVELARTAQEAHSLVEKLLASEQEFLIQEFIEEAGGADIRVFVVGDKAVAAMKRQGKNGEFRSNIYLGGSAEAVTMDPAEARLAVNAAQALGLGYAGVDLLRSKRGPLIIELNASPGLEGIETTSGVNVAGAIIEYLELQFSKQLSVSGKLK